MKQAFAVLILFIVATSIAFADTSTNEFTLGLTQNEIPTETPPVPAPDSSSSSGLSGGAVTAIAVGSSAAGAVGIAALALLNAGLPIGFAAGIQTSALPLCLTKEGVRELIGKNQDKPLLVKALEQTDIKDCSRSKYLIIPDSEIIPKSFNTVSFEPPLKQPVVIKMMVVTDPVSQAKFDTKVVLDSIKNKPLKLSTVSKAGGVETLSGTVDFSNTNTALVVNSLGKTSGTVKYAYVIEFEF